MNNPIPPNEAWGITRGKINNKAELTEGSLDPTQIPPSVQLKSGDGINYIVVDVSAGNAVTNGQNLRAAYNAAKLLTPNGSALATDNRAVVFLPPAVYEFDGVLPADAFTLDADYVDVIGVSPNRDDVFIYDSNNTNPITDHFAVTALDVYLANFTFVTESYGWPLFNLSAGSGVILKNLDISFTHVDESSLFICANFAGVMEDVKASARIAITSLSGRLERCTFDNLASDIAATVTSTGKLIDVHSKSTLAKTSMAGYMERCSALDIARGSISGTCKDSFSTWELGFWGPISGKVVDCAAGFGIGSTGSMTGVLLRCEHTMAGAFPAAPGGHVVNCYGSDWTEYNVTG